jgi:hypothetical protein
MSTAEGREKGESKTRIQRRLEMTFVLILRELGFSNRPRLSD